MNSILIIIPALNEEESIGPVIDDVDNVFSGQADVIVVNDGSRDRTAKVAKEHGANVLNFSYNQGAGAAAQAGYIYAHEKGYAFAGQMDGDGQHRAEDLKKMFEALELGSGDLIIGSRYLNRTGFQSSFIRRAGGHVFKFLLHVLTGNKVTDITSGLRAGNKKTISLFSIMFDPDYAEIEALQRALNSGLRVKEVPVLMRERQGGVTSISPTRAVSYTLKNLLVLFSGRMRRSRDQELLGKVDP